MSLAARATGPAGQHAVRAGRAGRWTSAARPLRPLRCSTSCAARRWSSLAAAAGPRRAARRARPAGGIDAMRRSAAAGAVTAAAEHAHAPAQLHLLVRTPEQLEAALDAAARPASRSTTWISTACARRWSACRRRASTRARGQPARAQAQRAAHRQLPAPAGLPDPGALRRAARTRCRRRETRPLLIGDFSLNAANVLTAASSARLGARRASRPPTTSTPPRWPNWPARSARSRSR